MTNTFWNWWQHLPQSLSPVLLDIGPIKIHYYGLMYILAFGTTYGLVIYRIRREPQFRISEDTLQGLTTAMIIGLLLGARLGYVLFYNLSYYLHNPLEIVLPFDFSDGIRFTGITGMSYHGGLVGVIVATVIFIRRHGLDFRNMADLYIPVIPLGYTFGRLGNFINGELYGRATTAAYGMRFPQDPQNLLRHPSQLYEAFFEGIFLFIVLWSLKRTLKTNGAMLSFYLFGYGFVRFFIEFTREPDAHLGFVLGSLSMGQVLCIVMMLSAAGWYAYLATTQRPANMQKS